MTYLYLLAGENLKLAKDEIKGFLRSQDKKADVERKGKLVLSEAEPMQLRRLALTHEISKLKEKGSIDEIKANINIDTSFKVRAKNIENQEHDTKEIESRVGEKISNENNEVNLDYPKTVVNVYLGDENYYIGTEVENINRGLFNKRSNEKRPFSSPISMDPVLARILINLSETKPGENIIDPFCGTGGILIEAGLCGIGVHGLDIDKEKVKGTRENLEEYGIINHNIKQGKFQEFQSLFKTDFEAIITDLPYGKASKKTENIEKEFLDKIRKTDTTIVFMSNKEELGDLEPSYEKYIHKNLTRYIYQVNK